MAQRARGPAGGLPERYGLRGRKGPVMAAVVAAAGLAVVEALTGVQVTLLTIYDMCKAIDKHMVMSDIHLEEKTGGKSGDFRFEEK